MLHTSIHRSPLQILLLLTLFAITWLNNARAQTCPDVGTASSAVLIKKPVSSAAEISKLPVEFNFTGGESVLTGESDMVGAEARQGDRSISADILHYNSQTGVLKADGNVSFEDTQLRISGNDANLDAGGGVEFDQANFTLKTVAGRGSASRIQLSPQGTISLDNVSYTTCPPASADWKLTLSDLDINQTTSTGTGRNVKLDFMGVPIFYTPWISFPVGNQRKSGFLFPNLRSSSRGGYSLWVPWYWNLAPNYDATLTPIIDTKRGFDLDTEFRYLTATSKGTLLAGYLPYDQTVQGWRGLLELKHRSDFNSNLRLEIAAGNVSDNQWFEDFGQGRDETSQVFIVRSMSLTAYSQNWEAILNVQNLQVLDYQLALNQRPYSALPQFTVSGHETRLPLGLAADFNGELGYFTRNKVLDGTGNPVPDISGARAYLAPTLSLPLRSAGMYLLPSASWRYTAQQLQHTPPGQDRTPSVSAPIWSVDTGMVFERLSGNKQQRLYTLEPRLLYVNAPYRPGQRNLQVFDTGVPDFNFVQLFRTDRFVGPDRLGDANQLSVGITSRMLDSGNGTQFLSGTIGQAFYFKVPCVTAIPATNSTDIAQFNCDAAGRPTLDSSRSSDLIGQVSLTRYKNWNASAALQWDPTQKRSELSEVNFQYTPGRNRVINLSYRFVRTAILSTTDPTCSGAAVSTAITNCQNNAVDQWESSFAWPVGVSWNTYGRAVYSRIDNKLHDYLAGLEYRSCCWNLRVIAGRSITTRSGEYDTKYGLQLELKGLSSVGNADAFLQSSIPGYSARAAGAAATN